MRNLILEKKRLAHEDLGTADTSHFEHSHDLYAGIAAIDDIPAYVQVSFAVDITIIHIAFNDELLSTGKIDAALSLPLSSGRADSGFAPQSAHHLH